MPEPVHLPERIETDAHRLYLALMLEPDRKIIMPVDTAEYAEAVLTLLEGMYPGAREMVTVDVIGRWPGTTG